MNKLELTPLARDDVRVADAWYERQSAGLGTRFLEQLEECLDLIRDNPLLFAAVYKQYRRALVRKFPYVVFYTHESDVVTVHTVFHASRNPRKWQQRLE